MPVKVTLFTDYTSAKSKNLLCSLSALRINPQAFPKSATSFSIFVVERLSSKIDHFSEKASILRKRYSMILVGDTLSQTGKHTYLVILISTNASKLSTTFLNPNY